MIMWDLESWVLEFGTQLEESGIPLTIENKNPKNVELSSWNLESMPWNPECKIIVWITLYVGRSIIHVHFGYD